MCCGGGNGVRSTQLIKQSKPISKIVEIRLKPSLSIIEPQKVDDICKVCGVPLSTINIGGKQRKQCVICGGECKK